MQPRQVATNFSQYLAFLLFTLVCGTSTIAADAPTFERDILPLFKAKCLECHSAKAHKADLDLSSAAGVLKGGESGTVIVPGKADESVLFEKVHEGEMPPAKKDRLTSAEVETIRLWIEAGLSTDAAFKPVTQHDVIPILLRHCTVCHGRHRQEGGLDLRTVSSMKKGGKSGPAFVPGKPEMSRLIQRVRASEMPPLDRLVEVSIKPIEADEIETLSRWIAAGAPESDTLPDVATTTPDTEVSDKDRDFWAFKAPTEVAIPSVPNTPDATRVHNPVDAFILQKLHAKGLGFNPEAERATLIRRASFDLTGLPPEPAEVQAFLSDNSPDAYEKMVDRLLASPRYGERWGRYWLDASGYAESEGKREQDLPRPYAWRYRDYVIRAFNTDKPYDRFLLEQIAGDELADIEHAADITPEMYDNLVATAFLRQVPDATWANITGFIPDRIEVVADEIDVLGSSVMGLTLKCCRCHSHKFDPLPQRDYYRLVDIFKGAYDEYNWLKPDVRPGIGPVSQDPLTGRHLPYVTTAERQAWEARNAMLQQEADALRMELEHKAKELTAKLVEQKLQDVPEGERAAVKVMLETPADKRDATQKALAEKFEKTLKIEREALKTLDPAFKQLEEDATKRIQSLVAQKRPEPRVQALWDRGEPSPTYVYRRGDPLSPGKLVGPGVPSVLTDGKTPFDVIPPWPGSTKTGRRLAFARWLTRPDHPLTGRVVVNRMWKQHFGSGLVKTLGNFGKTGTPPTHPELLDWLAREFVKQGWSFKAMHRLMLTSATYRQSSAVSSQAEQRDIDNSLLSRMPLVRLDAEALYDTMLLAAGRLDETPGGPADTVAPRGDGLITPNGTAKGWRRLIYVQQFRKQLPSHLETFDFPQMNPNCLERRDSTVAPQALHLMNNGMVQQLSEQFARRVLREAGTDPAKQIDTAWLIALSHPPSEEERQLTLTALRGLTEQAVGAADQDAATVQALTTICHALMNSASLLYVD